VTEKPEMSQQDTLKWLPHSLQVYAAMQKKEFSSFLSGFSSFFPQRGQSTLSIKTVRNSITFDD
jgi:hypothetical protein